MNERGLPSNILRLIKREYKEKKPISAKILRVKSEHFISMGGPEKVLSISRTQEAHYLVMVEYGEQIRIYYFSKRGEKLGGENFEKTQIFMKNLAKKTKIIYKIPR